MLQNYSGPLRRVNNNNNEYSSNNYDKPSRSRYQQSQISYYQSQSSVPHFQEIRTQRPSGKITEQRNTFNGNIPIKVKPQDRQIHYNVLRVEIQLGRQKNMPYILIHLTNDSDPLFLYNFRVTQTDYINLKKEQNIKVDFSEFPQMMQEFLREIINQKQGIREKGFLYAQFESKKGGDAQFSILEAGRYKDNINIKLKFKIGNDEQIKKYLASKFVEQRTKNEQLAINNSKYLQTIQQRTKDLQTQQALANQQIRQLQQKMNAMKNRQSQLISQTRRDTENEWRKIQQQIKDQLLRKQNQLKNEKKQNKKAYDRLVQQFQTLKKQSNELTVKYETLKRKDQDNQNQLGKKKIDYSRMQKQFKQSNEKNNTLQKKIVQLQTIILGYQRQLKDKQQIIHSGSQIKENTSKQIVSLQQKARQYKQQKQKMENKCNNLQSQLEAERREKQSFRSKYQKAKQKKSSLANILTAQQNSIRNIEEKLDQKKQQLRNSQKKNQDVLKQLQDFKKSNKTLKQELNKSNRDLSQKIQLIDHLNRKLNDKTSLVHGIKSTGFSSSNYSQSLIGGIGSTSRDLGMQSRYKYSNTNLNAEKSDKNIKIEPPMIKRYTGTTPVKEKQISDRTLSPSMARLNQQTDPEDQSRQYKTKEIKPVKFKFGQ